MSGMAKDEDSGSPSWASSFFMQTTEDVARAVAAAATVVNSPRPSVIFSSKDDHSSGNLQRFQNHVSKLIKGFSRTSDVKVANYNPEVLTSQKRQWAENFQLQYLDHRSWKEPTRLFESMVVVGLHPNCDIQALQRQYVERKSEGSGKFRSSLGHQNQSRVEPSFEPQVLFVYPPEKHLPLKYKDLISFCFPGGLEVRAVERTPSMSELNEILLGQEHLKQSDLSFVFRLQGADNSTLYGCCVLVEELVQKPSGLLSLISDKQPPSSLRRHILTTQRCYCILSRVPFFELHFGVLNSIFTQERLERLTKSIGDLNLEFVEGNHEEEPPEDNPESVLVDTRPTEDRADEMVIIPDSSSRNSIPESVVGDDNHSEHQMANGKLPKLKEHAGDEIVVPVDSESEQTTTKGEPGTMSSEDSDLYGDTYAANKQSEDKRFPNAILPLLRYSQYESSESSCSFQGSPCEDRNFRSDIDDTETEEASISGQEDLNDLLDILEWAKENNNGPLQIISEYYRLGCPARGSSLRFHPMEHLHSLEYHRQDETVLRLAGSTFDLKSFKTGLEWAEAQNALLAEEEATALSIWAVACICGTLKLENVLAFFAGALLEKQIVVVCSNLGILSASVLSVIPLIRPYQWQSLLMPVLPNDMLEFLDAPVPYVVGVKHKTNELQSKLTNVVLVDANRNQVKSPTMPLLPRQKELVSALRPHHAKLVGESYLARKRPMYECTEVQVEAAKGFLSVLRSYLDSLCCNIRSHTITNVQSNDDKVSLLLKESFIDSFAYRDQPFMKLFVDTQLFSVHTDLVLSFFQKE